MFGFKNPKSRDSAGRIKPQTQLTIEAIQAMIAEDEAAVAAAEAELRSTALDASLINDPFPARGHLDRLREAQDRLEVHRHALALRTKPRNSVSELPLLPRGKAPFELADNRSHYSPKSWPGSRLH